MKLENLEILYRENRENKMKKLKRLPREEKQYLENRGLKSRNFLVEISTTEEYKFLIKKLIK